MCVCGVGCHAGASHAGIAMSGLPTFLFAVETIYQINSETRREVSAIATRGVVLIAVMIGAGMLSLLEPSQTLLVPFGALAAWFLAAAACRCRARVFQWAERKPDLDAGVYADARAALAINATPTQIRCCARLEWGL